MTTTITNHGLPQEVQDLLQKPFDDKEISFLPKQVRKSYRGDFYEALRLKYVTKEAALRRLREAGLRHSIEVRDDLQGKDWWVCTTKLTVKWKDPDGNWVEDIFEGKGESGRRFDDSEISKEAATDSMKRAFCLVGIGEYLAIDKGGEWVPCEVMMKGDKPFFKRWIEQGESPRPVAGNGKHLLSASQLALATRMVDEAKISDERLSARLQELYGVRTLEKLSGPDASKLIDMLKALPKAGEVPV